MQYPVPIALVALQTREMVLMDFGDTLRRDYFGCTRPLDPDARLVLVKVLAFQAGLFVVGPDECLSALQVVMSVGIVRG